MGTDKKKLTVCDNDDLFSPKYGVRLPRLRQLRTREEIRDKENKTIEVPQTDTRWHDEWMIV